MKTFSNIREGFDWWIKTIYPTLTADQKKGKLLIAWRDYTYNRGISESRMRDILVEFGHFEIKISVVYKP